MTVDLEKYRPYLDGFDMTQKHKDEYLETIWQIVGSFVDEAWAICGYIGKSEQVHPDGARKPKHPACRSNRAPFTH